MKDERIERLIRARWSTFCETLDVCTGQLAVGLDADPKSRVHWKKPDRSTVTIHDLTINMMVIHTVMNRFPGDSVMGEEISVTRRPECAVNWLLDPIDDTNGFLAHKPGTDSGKKSPGVMLSLTVWGRPVAFGLSLPLADLTYRGNIDLGIQRNHEPHIVPPIGTGLLVGINDDEHTGMIQSAAGIPRASIACLTGMLMLEGYPDGGLIRFHKPHEAACLAAIAACTADTTLTDLNGNPYTTGTDPDYAQWAVFSRDHRDSKYTHEDVLAKARTAMSE